MRRWVGLWIIAVAVLHIIVAFLIYPTDLIRALDTVLKGSIAPFTTTSEAFWFLFFAPFLFLTGMLIDKAERRGTAVGMAVPVLMAITVIAMILPMPETGAWLLVPALIGLFLRERRLQKQPELQNAA